MKTNSKLIEELDFLIHILKKRNLNSGISFSRYFTYKYPQYQSIQKQIEALDQELKKSPKYLSLLKELDQLLEDLVYSQEK